MKPLMKPLALLILAVVAMSTTAKQNNWIQILRNKMELLEQELDDLDSKHEQLWNSDINESILEERDYVQELVDSAVAERQEGIGTKSAETHFRQLKAQIAYMAKKMRENERRIQTLEAEIKSMKGKTDNVIISEVFKIGCGSRSKQLKSPKFSAATRMATTTSGVTKFPVPTRQSPWNKIVATRLLSVGDNGHQFYQTDLVKGHTTEYPLTSAYVDAVTFVSDTRQIIWVNSSVDSPHSGVYSVDISGGNTKTLLSQDNLILSLAVDSSRGLLYFTSLKPLNALHVLLINEKNYKKVVDLQQLTYPPKALALHTRRQLVFVAHISGVAQFDYHGRGQQDIIQGDWIDSITIDKSDNAIYYSDNDKIHRYHLDSNTVQVWRVASDVQTIVSHNDVLYIGYEHFPYVEKLETKTGRRSRIETNFRSLSIMCLIP